MQLDYYLCEKGCTIHIEFNKAIYTATLKSDGCVLAEANGTSIDLVINNLRTRLSNIGAML